ncbi:hypothetical protein [Asticcacaulis sp.]|uniref:hypothetical protein n=1 Tax=Asticcacaulis sp. TaxID=1872648 RepID=UPI0026073754|nr:hypothetical protein [Asticcacaulis sp.]
MPVYTLFLDYKGGTYIAQRRAPNPREALRLWATQPEKALLSALGDDAGCIESLAAEIGDDNQLVPIQGMTSVWCASFVVEGELALINIVQTEPS